MSSVDFKTAKYKIAAKAKHPFTFWWPGGKAEEYFDVQIMPVREATLQETKRELVCEPDGKGNDLFVLKLTIQNEENFEVEFQANHIHIH